MSLSAVKREISDNLYNLRGWRGRKKFVVFESDDWGSLRMPSKKVYESMLRHGVAVDRCAYNRFDALETPEDLSNLFDVLSGFRDAGGRHPVITANTIMANPDFAKIRANDYASYAYETFTETFRRYGLNSFEVWNQGITQGVFHPQLHGREHLQVNRWMDALQRRFPETRIAFDHEIFGISTTITTENRKTYLAAFDYEREEEQAGISTIVNDATTIFEQSFGFRSTSFIAPNYVWDNTVEDALQKAGVQYLQGTRFQKLPVFQGSKGEGHAMGDVNMRGQRYLLRNCLFEPSLTGRKNIVEECVRQMAAAFRWRKPAIVSTHRLNFIGTLDAENARQNLLLLQKLLREILKRWPDVEFTTSDRLGKLMST